MALFICGCVNKVDVKGNVLEMKYNDTIILNEDYSKVLKLLPTTFYNKEVSGFNDTLTIKTDENIYFYKISDKYIEFGGKVSFNDKIGSLLENLESKYNNTNFYSISYVKNYEGATLVSLDKTSNYIVLNLYDYIKNFKINEIEMDDSSYQDVDLLYEKDSIDKGNIVIRKSINYDKPDIKISFQSLYGLNISIIPQYDSSGKVNFKVEQKNA